MRIILPPDDRVIVSLRNIQKNIVFNNPLQHIPRLHIAAIKYIEREYGARGYFSANVYKYNFARRKRRRKIEGASEESHYFAFVGL